MVGELLLRVHLAAVLLAPVAIPARADDDLKVDQRLQRGVTISGARLYVAEVAEALAKQTGVPIVADEASGASDARVLVRVTDCAAWRVMRALESLFSHRQALWLWERSGDGYRLVRTRGAQALPERLAAYAQAEFETTALAQIRAAPWSPEAKTQRMADPKPVTIDERASWGLSVFADCLTEPEQLAVLRGESSPVLPVERLSGWGRRLVEDVFREHGARRRLPDGTEEPVPSPTWIRFTAVRLGTEPTPSLYLDIEGVGGYAYTGGLPLQRSFGATLADLWIGDGDVRADATRESARVPMVEPSQEAQRLRGLARRCVEIAECTGYPVVARVPSTAPSSTDRGSPAGVRLGAYLESLRMPYDAWHKWREGVLLVTYTSWFRNEEELAAPPWVEVRRLREACAANQGLVTVDSLLDAARALTSEQLRTLSVDWAPAELLSRFRDLLARVASEADLRRTLVDTGTVSVRGSADPRGALMVIGRTGRPVAAARALVKAGIEGDGPERKVALTIHAWGADGSLLVDVRPRWEPGGP